jgi:hypothetical protein
VKRIFCLIIALAFFGCVRINTANKIVTGTVSRFTSKGFPEMTVADVYDLFDDEDACCRLHSNGDNPYWYSKDGRYTIDFESTPCVTDGTGKISSVILTVYTKSRAQSAAAVYRWLEAAQPLEMPPKDISDDKTGKYYESTWTKEGKLIHVKAWVVKYKEEWYGVLHLYPQEVWISSAAPNKSLQPTQTAPRQVMPVAST